MGALWEWVLDSIRGLKCSRCGERYRGAARLDHHGWFDHYGEQD